MAEVLPLRLSPSHALKMIRELAADSGRIVVVRHGRQRSRERGITRTQIERCLQKGVIAEGPALNMHGHWQVTMRRRVAGEEVTCVVAIEWATRLLVITTY